MERDATKHGSRLDDQMKEEVGPLLQAEGSESRAQEHRVFEDGTDHRIAPADEIEQRSTIARFLNQATFPADRAALLEDARQNQAIDRVLNKLEGLPEGKRFQNVQEVWEALGGSVEQRF